MSTERKYMKKILVALAAGLVAASAVAMPAIATPPDTEPVCWTLRSIVQEWQEPADGSKVVSAHTVTLTKPEGGGTEFVAKNLGLEFDSPVTIEVFYTLSPAADYAAGAVRLFYYEAADPNTLTDAPTKYDAAASNVGVLTLSDVLKVGAVGVVYDASNTAAGKVTFTHLKIGKKKMKFKQCPEQTQSPSPSPSASNTTSPAPTSSATTTAAPEPSVSTSLAAGPSLPVTGRGVTGLFLVGLVLTFGGGAVLVAARLRRRRERFEA